MERKFIVSTWKNVSEIAFIPKKCPSKYLCLLQAQKQIRQMF